MANINLNYSKKVLEISKSFEKSASAYGSAAYLELAEARKAFPDFTIRVVKSKKTSTDKGMGYDFMEEYISTHENSEINLANFNKLKAKLVYGEVKQRFVNTYPVFKNCATRAEWVLAA